MTLWDRQSDDRGLLVGGWRQLAYQGRFAAARVVTLATGTYFIVVEVTSSPVERTHWAMVYGAKRIGSQNAISGR